MKRHYPLMCCICGANAGRWEQHWNRDTGWGICPRCAANEAEANGPEPMERLYGKPGINYEAPSTSKEGSDGQPR